MAEIRKIAQEIKGLIGIGAAILFILILAVTFVAGFYLGWSSRVLGTIEKAAFRGFGPGPLGERGAGPGPKGEPGLRERIKELGGTVIRGKVISISGNTLTIQPRDGKEVKVVLAKDAVIERGREPATVSEIKVGDPVVAVGKLTDDTLKAKALRIIMGTPGGFRQTLP